MSKGQTYKGILSVMAMLAIAICNVSSDIWSATQSWGASWNFYGAITAATQWGIPLLIGLFGMIYLDRDIYYSTNIVYKKLLPQAMVACCFWWIISALIQLKTSFSNELDMDTFLECMGSVLREPYNVFLLQLFAVMFAFYPLLTRIIRDDKLLLYGLVTSFVICMLLPALEKIPYVRYINLFTEQINWNFFTAYGFYLLLGIWVTRTKFEWHYRTVIYCLGVLSSVAMLCLTKIISASALNVDTRFISIGSPFVAWQALAVLVLVKQLVRNEAKNSAVKAILKEFSGNLYGFVVLYVMVFNLISYYIPGVTGFFLPVCSFVLVNILCTFMKRLPVVSFLLCSFKVRGDRI